MKLIEALQEKELKMPKYMKTDGAVSFGLWVNPSKDDIRKAIKESSEETSAARFIADPTNFKLYIFRGDVLHEKVRENMPEIKAPMLMYGLIKKNEGKYKGYYGDVFGDFKDEPYYEKVLKENWQWLNKYFDTEPIFRTLMMRYKNEISV